GEAGRERLEALVAGGSLAGRRVRSGEPVGQAAGRLAGRLGGHVVPAGGGFAGGVDEGVAEGTAEVGERLVVRQVAEAAQVAERLEQCLLDEVGGVEFAAHPGRRLGLGPAEQGGAVPLEQVTGRVGVVHGPSLPSLADGGRTSYAGFREKFDV